MIFNSLKQVTFFSAFHVLGMSTVRVPGPYQGELLRKMKTVATLVDAAVAMFLLYHQDESLEKIILRLLARLPTTGTAVPEWNAQWIDEIQTGSDRDTRKK